MPKAALRAPQPVRRDPVAVVRVPERWLLVRPGAALVREWNRLPMPLQRAV